MGGDVRRLGMFVFVLWMFIGMAAGVKAQATEPLAEAGAALTVRVALVTGADGTGNALLFRLRRDDGVLSEAFVLGQGALANSAIEYAFETGGRVCDFTGFELTTDGSDAWDIEVVSISLQTTTVYRDDAAEVFAPLTADTFPVNGSWAGTAAFLTLCQPGALPVTPTPRPTLTPSPTPTATPVLCVGALPPRLRVGGTALVNSDAASNLREQPDRNATRIGQVPGRGTIQVLAGPVCDGAGGIVWWQVAHDGRIGWVAEGLDDEYFLVPTS
jgi:hypothetical protein